MLPIELSTPVGKFIPEAATPSFKWLFIYPYEAE
jgi:hypothetical protein